MQFNLGDEVQPNIGGRKMQVAAVTAEGIICQWEENGKIHTKTYQADELSLYKLAEPFGVC